MSKSITKKKAGTANKGLKINRYFTQDGIPVYELFKYEKRSSVIRNPSGDAVFEMNDVEVPASWSQVATDILAQKYFRKAGIPKALKRVEEETIPSWLWRSVADDDALAPLAAKERTRGEVSAKEVFNRLAGT